MTLFNNFEREWGVGVFLGVGIISRGYGISNLIAYILQMVWSMC